jgi:hypothetical protein
MKSNEFLCSLEDANQDRRSWKDKILLTLHYSFIVLNGQIIMFLLMTYNFWIILSMIVGNGVGYFFFHSNKSLNIKSNASKLVP